MYSTFECLQFKGKKNFMDVPIREERNSTEDANAARNVQLKINCSVGINEEHDMLLLNFCIRDAWSATYKNSVRKYSRPA